MAAGQNERLAYQPIPSSSLSDLRTRMPFPEWTDYVEPENLRLSRRIVRDLIDDLITLEGSGDEVAMLDAFRRAVGRFNATEDGDDPFIATIEREDICERLFEAAEAAGLTDYDVASWRDW
jgi:hypothetical protein